MGKKILQQEFCAEKKRNTYNIANNNGMILSTQL